MVFNPYEKKSGFESFGGGEESLGGLPEKEKTPEEIKEYQEKLEKRSKEVTEHQKYANNLTEYHYKLEAKENEVVNDVYDAHLKLPDYMFGDSSFLEARADINTMSINPEKIIPPPEKQFKNPESISEKEKVREYAVLSNLSYSKFKTVKGELTIDDVELDPLSHRDLLRLLKKDKPEKMTADEEYIYKYVHNPENRNNVNFNEKIEVASDIERVLKLSNIYITDKYFADVLPGHRSVLSDVENAVLLPNISNLERRLLIQALKDIKGQKIIENGKTLEGMGEKYEIRDYFPNKNDIDNSSFGAVCLIEKGTGKKIFAMRGTDIEEFGCLISDKDLVFKNVPEKQTIDMINFIERNIKLGEKFKITGHSLGGALSQIAKAMYKNNVIENYTFNSPGAKKLNIDSKWGDKSEKGILFEKFREFGYNKEKLETGKNVVNVKGEKGPKLITNLGEDIGEYELNLKDLKEHGIKDLINYIDKYSQLSEFIKVKHEKSDSKKDKNKKTN
ncbi:MAG: hypothetical protein PHZ26_01930 [Candidatus Gracilibacteria bacterium]|nr:hypothetical protein [Candidatus Gracilibacteria bacterium]MDD2908493.1 hypothetical protein [Candidatus Gracilibacteria bacterium]